MAYAPLTKTPQQFFDSLGNPLSGGVLYAYLAGTSTPTNLYSDNAGTVAGTSVTLDSRGEPTTFKLIWLDTTKIYKLVLKDSLGSTIWTVDNLSGDDGTGSTASSVFDQQTITATAGQTLFNLGFEYVTGTNAMAVYKNGARLITTTDFTENSSTSVTLTLGAQAGDEYTFIGGQDVSSSFSSANVSFIQSGTGSTTRSVQTKLREFVSVKDFGAVGDGVTDDTAAISATLSSHDEIYIPAGEWLVDYIHVAASKKIRTAGKATIIKQKPQTGLSDKRVIFVEGSNVEIESLTIEGNISTDSSEHNHGIYIYANATTGTIQNVTIGDVHGKNIRGDVVYIGADTGYTLSGVNIGHVTADNVYRNVVSITGGSDIDIKSITGSPVGLFTLDVEPEPSNTPATGIHVGYIKGKWCGLQSASTTNFVDGVVIDVLDLNSSYVINSTPSYSSSTVDGLTLRNAKSVDIRYFKVANYDRFGIGVTYNPGELGCQDLHITYLNISDCSNNDATYNAYINAQPIERLSIESLVIAVDGTSKIGFLYGPNIVVNNITGTLASGCYLARYSSKVQFLNGSVTGGRLVGSITSGGAMLKNFTHDGEILLHFTHHATLENVVATESTSLFSATYDDHIVKNSTLDSVYYADGFTVRDYAMAYRFGGHYLWVDGSSRLRIKSSAPTSDTDGTVVGTQT